MQLIKALEFERQEYTAEVRKCRREAQATMTYCNYELRSYTKTVGDDMVYQGTCSSVHSAIEALQAMEERNKMLLERIDELVHEKETLQGAVAIEKSQVHEAQHLV